jgi:hypothetical protein
MAVVGSMEVAGIYHDLGLILNLQKVKQKMKEAARTTKEMTVELARAAKGSSTLTKVMGLIGLGGFASLLSGMPRVNAELTQAKTWVSLIALEMDDNLAPAAGAVSDALEGVYEWFSGLTETQQSIIIWSGIVVGALTSIGVASVVMSEGLKGLTLTNLVAWFSSTASSIAAFVAGSLAAQVAIGVVIGLLGVLALDKAGVLDYISNLGEGFRTARENGETWAEVLTVLAGTVALVGDAILALLGIKGWDDFYADLKLVEETFDSLVDKIENFAKGAGASIWNAVVPSQYEIHATSGIAGYTGFHWLEAGEAIGNSVYETSSDSVNSGNTTVNNDNTQNITNYISGIQLSTGMSFEQFVKKLTLTQAESARWSNAK